MDRFCFVTATFLLFILKVYGANTNVKYEVDLEKVINCSRPHPPFAKRQTVIIQVDIHKVGGKTYFSGKNIVLEEAPFLNYTTRSYSIGPSGIREELMKVEQQNCRNFLGKTFLMFGKYRYNKRTCQLLKGTTAYKDLDLNKISHSVPNWHSDGKMVHQVNLVARNETVFCVEFFVTVKTVK